MKALIEETDKGFKVTKDQSNPYEYQYYPSLAKATEACGNEYTYIPYVRTAMY